MFGQQIHGFFLVSLSSIEPWIQVVQGRRQEDLPAPPEKSYLLFEIQMIGTAIRLIVSSAASGEAGREYENSSPTWTERNTKIQTVLNGNLPAAGSGIG
jgi:hypothetical protein